MPDAADMTVLQASAYEIGGAGAVMLDLHREYMRRAGLRTAVGRFNGSLATMDAPELGTVVIRDLIRRTGIKPEHVNEVIMGNVIQAGLGQNPARQSAILAGLPENIPAFTVNKVCGSGLKSVALAGQAVVAEGADAIIAGGMESMTNAPFVSKTMRWGQRLGNGEMIDTLINDALWDSFYDCHMGITAENVAEKYHINCALLVQAVMGWERPPQIGAERSAYVTFIMFQAAYYCEIVRAGIQSIPRGQVAAAQALGMNYAQTMGYIVLPQALRNMLPVLLTQTIVLFQDTSLVYVLSIPDFLGAASKVAQRDGRLVEMYLFAAVVYFTISCIASFGVRRLQARIAIIR